MSSDGDGSAKIPEEAKDLRGPLRELRQYALGNLDVDHDDIHRAAGLVEDPDVRALLAFAETVYEPVGDMPRDFWETKWAQRILRRAAGETAAKAVRQGDGNRAAYLTGLPSYESDVSGMDAVDRMSEWLIESENCKLIYIAALMGRGKTALAVKMYEMIWRYWHRVDRATEEETPTPELAANFDIYPSRSGVSVEQIQSWPELQEWADRGDSSDERWFIFDEASTELTAQSGANAQDVAETMGPFVKKMRKKGVNMIVIGHDKGDVHVAIRSMADFVAKPTLKKADIYEGIKKRKPIGHVLSVSGLPDSEWEFNTDDMASWEWGDREAQEDLRDDLGDYTEDDVREIRNRRLVRLYWGTDLSQSDLSDYFAITQPTVSTIIQEWDVEEEDGELVAISPDGDRSGDQLGAGAD
jgi:hypothetical protein